MEAVVKMNALLYLRLMNVCKLLGGGSLLEFRAWLLLSLFQGLILLLLLSLLQLAVGHRLGSWGPGDDLAVSVGFGVAIAICDFFMLLSKNQWKKFADHYRLETPKAELANAGVFCTAFLALVVCVACAAAATGRLPSY